MACAIARTAVTDQGPPPGAPDPRVAFSALWEAMTDLMGAAATATLLRRAARRAAARAPDVAQVVIGRNALEYSYELPSAWALAPLCILVHELRPLLVELTGTVVWSRLATMPELRPCIDGEST